MATHLTYLYFLDMIVLIYFSIHENDRDYSLVESARRAQADPGYSMKSAGRGERLQM